MPLPVAAAAAAPAAASAASSVAPAVIGGAAALGQGLLSSAFNYASANKQMRFQERLSNTAHQREVADLRKAGLNPILSARHGGASSPPGASSQVSSPDVAHSALSAALGRAQIEDINSGVALKKAQTRLALEERALKAGQGMALQAEIDAVVPRTQQFQADLERIRADIRRTNLESEHSAFGLSHSAAESKFYKGVGGNIAPWMKLNPLGNTGINLLRLKTK